MVQTTGSKLSTAELAALEHAFAADPTSDAYRPLAEAYLAMGRFMEAMVVCKKGAKARPNAPEARLLLARVYGEQGKDRKALEEIKAALDIAPEDADVLRYGAELHFKVGENEVGADMLKKAALVQPGDDGILALAKKHNIALARPPPPPVEPEFPAFDPLEQFATQILPASEMAKLTGPAQAPAQAPTRSQREQVPAAAARVPDTTPQAAPVRAPSGGSLPNKSNGSRGSAAHGFREQATIIGAPALGSGPASDPAPVERIVRPIAAPSASLAKGQARPLSTAQPRSSGGRRGEVATVTDQQSPFLDEEEEPSRIIRAKKQLRSLFGQVAITVQPILDLLQIGVEEVAEDDEAARERQSRRGLIRLGVTAGILVVLLGGWFGLTKLKAQRERQISKLLEETGNYIGKDTYASYKQATETADQILELDSDNYVAHAYLAYINALRWGEQGEGDDFKRRAEEHLKSAKESTELHGRIVAADAYIKFFNGDPKGAEEVVQAVVDKGQKSGLLYTTAGIVQMYAGDLDKAAQTLKLAQSMEPNSVRMLHALGQLNRRRGQDAEAWVFFDSALRLDKEHADSLLGKALLVLDANESSRPKEEQETLLKEAEEQIGRVLGLPSGAISARQLALGKFAMGQLKYARGKIAEASRLEQEARTLDPNNADIRLMAGRRLLREGKANEAVAEIRQAIEIDPKRASFYVDLSKALLAKPGGAKEAVSALRTALQGFPESGKIHVLLGDALRASGDVDQARVSYERAIEVEKGRMPEARMKLGRVWREKKDFGKAQEDLEKSLKELGLGANGPLVAFALTEIGRVLEEGPNKNFEAAWDQYEKAMESSSAYAPPLFFLGRLSASRADREFKKQAKDLLEGYVKMEPKGEFADEARSLLPGLR